MEFQFSRHYTIDEARSMLPQVRKWLDQIDHLRSRIERLEKRIGMLVGEGNDIGGGSVDQSVKHLSELKVLLREFESREILIKDIDRGLIDFPALRDGREVFLCWERGEEDIEHWHDLDTGFSGREPL